MKYKILFLLCMLSAGLLSAQTWDKMADLPVDFAFPVVVELNGEIHVMGGGGPNGATDLHIRYKPSTNKWDTLAPVPYKAQQPAGAVLNGKIHFFGGGFPNSGTRLDKHYAYDPGTDTWSQKADLPVATAIHKAAVLNGKLYCISGQPDKTSIRMYDVTTDTWTSKNALPDQNFWYSAMAVSGSGDLYRFGGGGYISPSSAAHKYNATTDSWTSLPALSQTLHAPAATAYGNFIFITGGYGSLGKVWLYDITNQNYIAGKPLPVSREYHDMVTIGSCIYSVGGSDLSDPGVSVSLLRYCPAANVSVKESPEEDWFKLSRGSGCVRLKLVDGKMETTTVSIYDITGRLVLKKQMMPGEDLLEFPAAEFPSSFYFIQLSRGDQMKTLRLPLGN